MQMLRMKLHTRRKIQNISALKFLFHFFFLFLYVYLSFLFLSFLEHISILSFVSSSGGMGIHVFICHVQLPLNVYTFV